MSAEPTMVVLGRTFRETQPGLVWECRVKGHYTLTIYKLISAAYKAELTRLPDVFEFELNAIGESPESALLTLQDGLRKLAELEQSQ